MSTSSDNSLPASHRRRNIVLVAVAGLCIVCCLCCVFAIVWFGYASSNAAPAPRATPKSLPPSTAVATAVQAPMAMNTPRSTSTPAPPTATPKPTAAARADPNVLTLAPGVTMELVRVPAGPFLMGSVSEDRVAGVDEKPQHTVSLGEYYIGKYEVTVAQWAAFFAATGIGRGAAMPQGKGNYPVTYVSWNDAVAFTKWASQVSGQEIRLPTEAEWEKAARGTDGRTYPWGNTPAEGTRGNFDSSMVGGTTPVGKYSPRGDSPYGAADMGGNVKEWTSSLRKFYPYQADDGREDQLSTDSLTTQRVLRGGSFDDGAGSARSAYRNSYFAFGNGDDIGFRVIVAYILPPTTGPTDTPTPKPTPAPRADPNVLTLAPGVTMELVRVPAGPFLMGSVSEDRGAGNNEKPQHTVSLGEYYIGKYEVTVAQWAAFFAATGIGRGAAMPQGKGNYPVTYVSWNDVQSFVGWASQVSGQEVRLPTEAEWEKAARGTDGRTYPWGNTPAEGTRGNFDSSMVGGTTPVGKYSPRGDSPYGAADMGGNVEEWTSSLNKLYPYQADDGREDQLSGDQRVRRGGSFDDGAWSARSAYRTSSFAWGDDDLGFRVVVVSSLPPATTEPTASTNPTATLPAVATKTSAPTTTPQPPTATPVPAPPVAKNTPANLDGKWEITYVGEFRDKAVYYYSSSQVAKGVFGTVQLRVKNLQAQPDNIAREYVFWAFDDEGGMIPHDPSATGYASWQYCGCGNASTNISPGWDTVLVFSFDLKETTGRPFIAPARLGGASRSQPLSAPRFAIDGFAQIPAFKPK